MISILVLCKKEMKNDFGSLLIALSVFDTMYLLVAILLFGLPKLSVYYTKYILAYVLPIGYV